MEYEIVTEYQRRAMARALSGRMMGVAPPRSGDAPDGGARREEADRLPDMARDRRLDLCRGVALWWIFLDHVPDNIGSWATLRHYGFSDAAEIFMFVSGMTCAVAYSRALRRDGWSGVVKRTLRRAWQIYVAFLLLALACAVLVHLVGPERFADGSNTRVLLEHPGPTLAKAALLQYRPVNTDVLPLFVAYHLMFAPLLWRLLRWPNATLAGSFLLYLAAWALGWTLPGRPYFNPLAWQFLVVLGAWCVVAGSRSGLARWSASRPVLQGAAAYLGIALAFSAANWGAGPVSPAFAWAGHLDKSGLDPLRLVHFLSVAVLAAWFVPRNWAGLDRSVARAAIACGGKSLPVFCFGVLLSLGAHMILVEAGGGMAMQIAISLGGVAAMVLLAALLDLATVARAPASRPTWSEGAVAEYAG